MASDQELITRSLAGDQAAFDDLVLRYRDALFRHLLLLAGNPDHAEDLCQEAFIRLYSALPRFDRSRPLPPLLFRIATNLWRDGRKRAPAPVTAGNLDQQRADCEAEVAEQAIERIEREKIENAVAQLRWEYRVVVSLRYDQGLSYGHIAEVMRVSVGTVASWLHRALDTLRAALKDEGGREVGP